MNIKKKNLYLELYPITYNDKKYMCTISRRKDFIFRFIRIGAVILFLVIVSRILFMYPKLAKIVVPVMVFVGIMSYFIEHLLVDSEGIVIDLDCCIFSMENHNKVFQTKIPIYYWEWRRIIKHQNYESLVKEIYKKYNIYCPIELDKKNWDGIISLEKAEVKGATDNDNRNYYG